MFIKTSKNDLVMTRETFFWILFSFSKLLDWSHHSQWEIPFLTYKYLYNSGAAHPVREVRRCGWGRCHDRQKLRLRPHRLINGPHQNERHAQVNLEVDFNNNFKRGGAGALIQTPLCLYLFQNKKEVSKRCLAEYFLFFVIFLFPKILVQSMYRFQLFNREGMNW